MSFEFLIFVIIQTAVFLDEPKLMFPGFRGKILHPSSKFKWNEERRKWNEFRIFIFIEGIFTGNKEKRTGVGLLWMYIGKSFSLVTAKMLYLFLICVKKSLFPSTSDAVYLLWIFIFVGKAFCPSVSKRLYFLHPFHSVEYDCGGRTNINRINCVLE